MNYNKRLVPICIIYMDGRRLNVGCEGAFRSVKVIDTLDNVSECTVRFDYADLGGENRKALGTDCLESDISVHIGYKDDTREVFSGRVTRVSVKHPERGPSICSVRATSYLSLLDHGTHVRAFENITPSQAIRDTLTRYNLEMAEYESFGPVIPYWVSYEKTDLQTVKHIAKRYGRDICCVGKKVYVKRLMTARQDEGVYEWGKSVIDFEGVLDEKEQVSGVTVLGHNPQAYKSVRGSMTIENLSQKIGGRKNFKKITANPNSAWIQRPHFIYDYMVKDDAEAQELAEAALREKSFKLMRAECNVEGDCRLASGATVMMKYVGQPFDGEYITHAVIHRFSLEEGYITNFFLKRNMVDEEYMKGPTHVAMHSSKSPATAERKAEEYEDNYGEEEEYEPLLKEILSVACCDKDGNETATCSEGQPLTVEVKCNTSVEDGATVTFNIYREGADPKRDDPVETLTAINRAGRAVAEWAYQRRRDVKELLEAGRRFFFRVGSVGCEEVQSGVVEIEVEEPAGIRIYVSPSSQRENRGVGNYGTEADRMQELSDLLVPILTTRGHTVFGGSNALTLARRIAESNASDVDIHVGLHSNAGGGTGPETLYLTGSASGRSLATAIQNQLRTLFGSGRGIKPRTNPPLGELGTNAVSVIVEVAFHDNLNDVTWMLNNWNEIARAIADGIDDYNVNTIP